MFEFAHPWLLLLALLALPMAFMPPYRRRDTGVLAPFFDLLQSLTGNEPSRGASIRRRSRLQSLLLLLSWLALVSAAARPQWLGEPVTQTRSARDLMIAVDISGSMATEDFAAEQGSGEQQPRSRLAAVKTVLAAFSRQRQHDRLGLIVFGDSPYLQSPFTEDHQTWETLLGETDIAMAGQGTALGDAIGLAIKHFRQSEQENRVLLLLTDGNDTASRVPPVDAAKVARSENIRIYPIAIGNPESTGEEAIDTGTLERIAEITHGAFFQALDPGQLTQVQLAIAAMEPEAFDTLRFQPKTSLHHYPIIAFAAFYLISTGLRMAEKRNPRRKISASATDRETSHD